MMRKTRCAVSIVSLLLVTTASAQSNGHLDAAARAEYARAEQAFQAGDLTRSSQIYSRILEHDNAQPFAWFRLGLAHHQLKNFRAALQAYDSALRYAEGAAGIPDLEQTVAKTRFNRALLLLDEVARDLQHISADQLNDELESTRVAVHEYVRAALRSAGSRESLDPVENNNAKVRARSYVYTAPAASKGAAAESR